MNERVEAHNELDRWAVPRDGMSLPERIRWLALRREELRSWAHGLEDAHGLYDLHVPDYPPSR